MTFAAPIARTDIASPSDVPSALPIMAAIGVTTLLTILRLSGTVDSDVAWQLWIAERIHAGANLYTDIVETNPPLWFWMAVPVERASALLHLRIETVLVLAIGFAAGLSLLATNLLIRHISSGQRALLLGYAALALTAVPWMHVGQREQIVLIATLPYAALIAARRCRNRVSVNLAVLIGIGGALGFALKQYFLIVPVSLELWLLAGTRWRPLRPETIALVVTGAIYAVALVSLEPDFLTRIVPLIRLAYGAFGAMSLRYMLGAFAVVGLVLVATLLSQAKMLMAGRAPFAATLTIAALAFASIYFIQFKGWVYHSIPMIGCASVGLAVLLAESCPSRAFRSIALLLLSLPLLLSIVEARQAAAPYADLAEATRGLRRGDTVGFLTTETAIPWSVTLQGGYRYASRYNGFWMMPAIVRNELLGNRNLQLAALGRQIVGETVDDFTCMPPRRIIVSRPRPGEDTFDLLLFFLRDHRFGALLSHYRRVRQTSLETYELVSPLPRPSFPCRAGV